MKRTLFFLAAAALCTTTVACSLCDRDCNRFITVTVGDGKKLIKPSGNLVTEVRKVDPFHTVTAGSFVKVVVGAYPEGKVTIKADDNILPYVAVSVEKGTLRIEYKTQEISLENPNVVVHVPSSGVTALCAESAAKITTEVTLIGEALRLEADSAAGIEASVSGGSCEISCDSAAKITADVDVASLTAAADSASKITLRGKAGKCSLEADSIAKIDASRLEAGTWRTEASTLAKISR